MNPSILLAFIVAAPGVSFLITKILQGLVENPWVILLGAVMSGVYAIILILLNRAHKKNFPNEELF